MVVRKRAKWCELAANVGPSERGSSSSMWLVKRSQATAEEDTREASALRRSNTRCHSEEPPWWPWQHFVSIAAGLLLAGLLALTQAWCVESLHENLLWFSELTVRVIRDRLPARAKLLSKRRNDFPPCSPTRRRRRFHVLLFSWFLIDFSAWYVDRCFQRGRKPPSQSLFCVASACSAPARAVRSATVWIPRGGGAGCCGGLACCFPAFRLPPTAH